MIFFTLTLGCLLDTSNPLFEDQDGDGVSVFDGDCRDQAPGVTAAISIGDQAFDTVQDALNAATAQDLVLICPGTYTENLLIDHDVNVQGLPGLAGEVILDGSGAAFSTLTVREAKVSLAGLTIQGGSGNYWEVSGGILMGGGVEAVNAYELSISESVVRQNAAGWGGGIAAPQQPGSVFELNDVTIQDNQASQFGGGLLGYNIMRLEQVRILDNEATELGGGLIVPIGSVEIVGGEISGNSATTGGGLFLQDASANGSGVVWENNSPQDIYLSRADGSGESVSGTENFECVVEGNNASCS